MSISGVAVSGRGAANPASAGPAFLCDFMPLERGADGPKEEKQGPDDAHHAGEGLQGEERSQ